MRRLNFCIAGLVLMPACAGVAQIAEKHSDKRECMSKLTEAADKRVTPLIARLLCQTGAPEIVIHRLIKDSEIGVRLIDDMLQDQERRKAVVDGLFTSDELRNAIPASVGRISFSESFVQEFDDSLAPKEMIAVLRGMLGDQGVVDLGTHSACTEGTMDYPFCRTKEREPQLGLDTSENNVYWLIKWGGGIVVDGHVQIDVSIGKRYNEKSRSGGNEQSGKIYDVDFFIEGHGVFFSYLMKDYVSGDSKSRPMAFGMFDIVSNGPYRTTDLKKLKYLDLEIRARATTMFEPAKDHSPAILSDGTRPGEGGILLYRIRLNVSDDQNTIGIARSGGHPVLMKLGRNPMQISGIEPSVFGDYVGCVTFLAPYGYYDDIDLRGIEMIDVPEYTHWEGYTRPRKWRGVERCMASSVDTDVPLPSSLFMLYVWNSWRSWEAR